MSKIDRTTIFALVVTVLSLIFIVWAVFYIQYLEKIIIHNQNEIEMHRATEKILIESMSSNYE